MFPDSTCVRLLLALLLLRLTCSTAVASSPGTPNTTIICSNPAIGACIKGLLEEYLFPLQQSLRNASNLLNSTQEEYVQSVWGQLRCVAEDPVITTIDRELTSISQTLSRLRVTWNSSYLKLNALRNNLTGVKVNVECGVELLEEEVAVLMEHVEQGTSKAHSLTQQAMGYLHSLQEMLAQFDQQKMNLSSQFISTNSALVEQHLDSAENLSVAFSVLDSMSNAVLSEAEQQLRSEESTEREAASLLNRTFHITAGMKNLSLILNEVNESVKTGQLTNTQARNAEKDILKEVVEEGNLNTGVELLLATVEGMARDAGVNNSAANQLVQNISQLLEESSQIMSSYEIFREQLQSLQIGADTAILHALALSQQVHTIIERGEMFLSHEFLDEFGRLFLINTTVSEAQRVIAGSQTTVLAHSVQRVNLAAVNAISQAWTLVERARNTTTPPLSPTVRQLTLGSLQYSRVHFSYLQVERQTASLEVKKSAMERELSEILERVNVIRRSLERANETMRGVSSLISSIDLDAIMAEINQTLSNTMDNLNYVTANGSEVAQSQAQLQSDLVNVSESVRERSDTQLRLNSSFSEVASLVSATYNIVDQIDYPLWFDGDGAFTLSPEQLQSPLVSGELRSVSLHFTPTNTSSHSVLLHLISTGRQQARTELLVEVMEHHLRVTLTTISPRGRIFSLPLTVSEREIEPLRTYSVIISRTGVNVHVELAELQSQEMALLDREASNRLSSAFSSTSFLSTATVHLGGGSPQLLGGLGYHGCLGGVEINSQHLSLWSLAFNSGRISLQPCRGNYSVPAERGGRLYLQLDQGRYAQQWVNGSFLPVVVEFRTLLPNGLLLYTYSPSSEPVPNSFSVYLELGRVEVRVRAGDRQRTLTSSQTYSNGAIHTLKIDLEGSAPRIVLRVGREVVKKRLQTVPVASLSTYSELLVGGAGVGVREREEISQSNFTGCISAYSLSSLLRAPKCFEREASNCSFCSSHEVAVSGDFYGASYAVFPAFRATAHFDISLKFRTYFGDGLMLFIGSAAQGMWLAMVLDGGRFSLLFQAGSNTPFSLSRGGNLNDSSPHTVTVIRSGFSLSILVDDTVFESPFGFALFFPLGLFPSNLFLGGIPPSQTDLLYAGTTWAGFKGQLMEVSVNGRAVDFSENLAAEAVVFGGSWRNGHSEGTQGQSRCDFHFTGLSSYAEFDIGRFPDNFSLSFQFNAESMTSLLFYVFSRRRADKMAVQLHNNTLQLYIQTEMRERLVSLPQQVSLREWHHVRVIRLAENITVTLDGELDMQETVILLQPLRTTSPLYIGGLPSDQRVPTTSAVVTDSYTGCLRTHYLTLATTKHGVEIGSCETQT